jgi:hypothetical protein
VAMMNMMDSSLKLEELPKAYESFVFGKDMLDAFLPQTNKVGMLQKVEMKLLEVESKVGFDNPGQGEDRNHQ